MITASSAVASVGRNRRFAETPGIFTISTIIAVLKLEKVIVNIAQVVKHIAKTDIFRVFSYLIFIRSAMFLLFFISLASIWLATFFAIGFHVSRF